jgi:hypothetical protein
MFSIHICFPLFDMPSRWTSGEFGGRKVRALRGNREVAVKTGSRVAHRLFWYSHRFRSRREPLSDLVQNWSIKAPVSRIGRGPVGA